MQDLECGNLYQKIELIILHSEHSSELPRHHNCSPLLAASGQGCDGLSGMDLRDVRVAPVTRQPSTMRDTRRADNDV